MIAKGRGGIRASWLRSRAGLASVALALACSAGPESEIPIRTSEAEANASVEVAAFTRAGAFELSRLGGGRVRLEDYRGKYLLLDFWATWCPPCILEIPELNAFYERFRREGVELLAIDIDAPDVEDLAGWASNRKVEYPIALGNDEVALAYRAVAFPFHVLVGPEGRVLEKLPAGFHDRDELAELIARHRFRGPGSGPRLKGRPHLDDSRDRVPPRGPSR